MKKLTLFLALALMSVLSVNAQVSRTVRTPKSSFDIHTVPSRHLPSDRQAGPHAPKQFINAGREQKSITFNKMVVQKGKRPFGRQSIASEGVYFLDDMESGINGWTLDPGADTNLWHQTTYAYISPTHSWWCAIESTGTYATGSRIDQSLISPAIDLSGATAPVHLLFNEWFTTEYMRDLCMVEVTADGGTTWTAVDPDSSDRSGDSYGWRIAEFDLSNYVTQNIKIRFHFTTTDELNNYYQGWIIDNVVVATVGGTISGVVYYDTNQNGVRDSLELPLSDIGVTATGILGWMYTSTDENGSYTFTLPAGVYTVEDTDFASAGWVYTSPSSGVWQVALGLPEHSIDTLNFGNWHAAITISGFVFSDANYNGRFDSGEALLAQRWIWLGAPSSGAQYALTDSSGRFSFVGIDTGQYYLWEGFWDGSVQTTPPSGNEYVLDVHDLRTNVTGIAFGNYYPPAYGRTCAIGGCAFNDVNRNSIKDSAETGFSGFEVDLHGNWGPWGPPMATTLTDSAGHYRFDSLYPGNYDVVLLRQLPHWINTQPTYRMFALIGGIRIDTANFGGYFGTRDGAIGGWVYYDLNRNGIKDSGEVGFRGVEVDLGDNEAGATLTCLTDSLGHYSFDNLYPGNYSVYLNGRSHLIITSPMPYYGFNLDEGAKVDTISFGGHPDSKTASIGGWLFQDNNENGIRDSGDVAIAGVQVFLNGDPSHFALSDSTGHYEFDSLYAGNNYVSVHRLRYWRITTPPWWREYINLTEGARIDTADFGAYPLRLSSISGQCFIDANKNGLKDPGERGAAGFTLRVTGTICNHFYEAEATSDSNGNYVIDQLGGGSYIVTEMLRPHWVQTMPNNFRPIIVTLDTAAQYTSADFGNSFDGTFNIGYRTFISDSIAHAKSYDGKKYGQPIKKFYITQATFNTAFLNSDRLKQTATSLSITLKYPFLDSLAVIPAANQTYDAARKSAVLNFPDGIAINKTVTIQGVCVYPKPVTKVEKQGYKATWTCGAYMKKTNCSYNEAFTWRTTNPNAIDMLLDMNGDTILIGMPRDRYASQTVLLTKYGDVVKSLVLSHGDMHEGPPRCLCAIGHPPRQMRSLTPKTVSNILFAEALALKVNLLASDLSITPSGFGDLVFDEGGDNPLNGKSIRAIAEVLDRYMSSYADGSQPGYCHFDAGYELLDSMRIYRTIRKIDSAFCGPIEYSSWTPGGKLTLLPVREVTDVPFVHIDSSSSSATKFRQLTERTPVRFELLQSYPNPFNPLATIKFSVDRTEHATLLVYDVLGREVVKLFDGMAEPGQYYRLTFDGSNLGSGMYVYRIVTDSHVQVKKMLLLK